MVSSTPVPPSADDVWRRLDAERSRPLLGLAGVGALLVIAAVLWWPHPVVYLVGLALLAIGLLSASVLLRGRRRWVAVGLVVVVTALAVLVPWSAAQRERTGDPHWTLATNGNVLDEYIDVERNRYIGSDDRSLFAVDLADGTVAWSVIDLGRVRTFDVSLDGYLLVRTEQEVAWVSPDGEIVWQRPSEGKEAQIDRLDLVAAVGAREGVVVFSSCEDEQCVTFGVGTDGTIAWRLDVFSSGWQTTAMPNMSEASDAPRQLPEAVVVDLEKGDLGAAGVVDAATGKVVETIEVAGAVAISGALVVYETTADDGATLCRSRATDLDGSITWEAQTPCLNRSGDVLGTWLYGAYEEPDGEVRESFAIDMRTGSWTDIGVLSWFNVDADAFGGVAGSDVVVLRDQQQLTGVDPGTGETLWSYDADGDEIPGVDVMHGAVIVMTYPDRGHNPFYPDREDGMGIVVLDSRTGRTTGRMTADHTVWDAVPVGPGSVVIADSSQLALIGER